MPLSAGDRLGQFEVTGELGAGGMGIVLRATDTQLNREVALKILPVTGSTPVHIHPDGKRIVYTEGRDVTQVWAVHNLELD